MNKYLQVAAVLLLVIMCLGCPNPLRRTFKNPVDPESDTYIGTSSEDRDGDGIPQYEDVDEIVLLSPKDGETITKLPLFLVTNKFNPAKVQKYWIQVATSLSDFDGTVVLSKDDYLVNECCLSAGIIAENITYYWRAKAFDGTKWSNNWSPIGGFGVSINIGVPLYPSPSAGSPISDTTPLLNWEDVAGASGYQVQVNTNDSFTGTMVADSSALVVSQYQVAATLSDNSTYYWHVKVKNADGVWGGWSSRWSFTVDVAPPVNPSPSSGSTIIDTTPLLDWEDVAGASGYQVQVNTNDSFTGTMVGEDSTLVSSQYQFMTTLSDKATYYWRVKVKNADGVWGDWSNTWNFTIDIAPPHSPSPSNGITIPDTTPFLNWEDVTTASGYHLQVNTNDSFTGTMVGEDSTLVSSQYQFMTTLSDKATYYWRVKVKNADGVWGDWSNTWNFMVDTNVVATAEKVSSGLMHSLALKSDGTLWACGRNYNGQLGTGDTTDLYYYTQVLIGVSAISAGINHSLALKSDGTLWACGENLAGQLGTGDNTPRLSFTQVLTGVSAISAGNQYSMALKSDGTLWACGGNGGKLGTGDDLNRNTYIQVLTGVSAISAGENHSLALKNDGTLWACGRNRFGQLGTGDTTNRYTYTQVLVGVSVIAAGNGQCDENGISHSLALKSDGTLWACGYNALGQLGTGDTTDRYIFTQVLTGVSAISASCLNSLALKSDGTLWACGNNSCGQLGTGDYIRRLSFTQILTEVSAISAGGGYTSTGRISTLKSNGSLWACGNNSWGQLGTGDTTSYNTFTQIFVY